MKRISAEEASTLKVKTPHLKQSRAIHIHREMNLLAVGEAVVIDKAEWPLKAAPNATVWPRSVTSMNRKYVSRLLADDSGYVITRVA